MILRKPYAFLAKHFKKIHFLLSILLVYLAYRTNLIFQFFNSYVNLEQNVIGQDLTSPLFSIFMFLIPFLWILLSIIILSLMVTKKKPFTFYVVNILMAIVVLVFYAYANNLVSTMELRLVDARVIRAIRDITMFVLLAQSIVSCMVMIRATGFDIKKFHFGEDLEKLDVKEEDREEFEVNFELDTDKTRRKLRRRFRYAKYTYVENKYLINLVLLIVFVISSFVIFMNVAVYHKTYASTEHFIIDGLNMQIQNVYIVTKDYKGNQITEDGKSLVVLDINVAKITSNKKQIEKAASTLIIGNHKYYHTEIYRDKLIDLGKTYELEEITKESQNYLFVYEVPTSTITKKMTFQYYDKTTFGVGLDLKSVKIKLNPMNLEEKNTTTNLELGLETTLKSSILKDSTLQITQMEINSVFVNSYQYCPKLGECYDSIEYIKPNIQNTYDKTLLKVTGKWIEGEHSHIQNVYDLYDFINTFGHIEYTLNGQKKTQKISFKEVFPTRNRKKNEYYIEILKEIEFAEEVNLIIQIRNQTYIYRIK